MPDPSTLQQIFVDALIARLEYISVAHGYRTNPVTVAQWRQGPLNPSELPALIVRDLVIDLNQKDQQRTRDKQDNSLGIQVQVECYDDLELIRLIIADIWQAINVDRTWGYLAIDTRPLKVQMAVTHEGNRVIGALVDFAIDYISGTFNAYS